jgi:hypothetical protein
MSFPARYDFPVYGGDTVAFSLTYKEGPTGSEVGVDLTGAALLCEIAAESAGSVVTTMTVTMDADQGSFPGKMAIVLPAAHSAVLTGRTYAYDIEATWADGTVQTFLYGTITVTREVSAP